MVYGFGLDGMLKIEKGEVLMVMVGELMSLRRQVDP
jgi:hypothetical protein